ncbi:MAG: DUF3034 family protein [Aquisalimonadaceae bacterium]
MPVLKHARAVLPALLLLIGMAEADAAGGRLPATSGVTQLEGAAGGGLVPWAVLSGYGTETETGGAVFLTHVNLSDFDLNAVGASLTINNRVELSLARQALGLGGGNRVEQEIMGAKVRLLGDLVYTDLPQISLGVQYKRNLDGDLVRSLGASRTDDWDIYLAASRLYLGAAGGYNLLLNGTLRATRANELGLLGFGGPDGDSHRLMLEASAAVLLDHRTAVGIEYRGKPDNLGIDEGPWQDLFFAWFPTKRLALTAAYARLGNVGGIDNQDGFYLSVQGSF